MKLVTRSSGQDVMLEAGSLEVRVQRHLFDGVLSKKKGIQEYYLFIH